MDENKIFYHHFSVLQICFKFIFLLTFLSQFAGAQGLNHLSYRIIGRADYGDAAGPRFAWPGTSVVVRFTGRAIHLRMRDRGNYFNLTLDGTPLPILMGNVRTESYRIANNLRDGAHELILTKRTEASIGETQILGFDLEPGKTFFPPSAASNRKIKIIGDSISCGFGIEGSSNTCPFTPYTENHSLTYGALTAHELGAELTTIAWSGKGVYRNFGGSSADPIPVLYPRILPERPNSTWNFQNTPSPQVVIIHLGTNDFSSGDPG